jgi:hypothetical protein
MRDQARIDGLNTEMIAKKAMLGALERGDLSHGGLFENRGLGIRQRIIRIAAELRELQVAPIRPAVLKRRGEAKSQSRDLFPIQAAVLPHGAGVAG